MNPRTPPPGDCATNSSLTRQRMKRLADQRHGFGYYHRSTLWVKTTFGFLWISLHNKDLTCVLRWLGEPVPQG